MKKSLIAIAALGSLTGGAWAQSSVTMFGVVDLSVRHVDNGNGFWQLAQDGMAASRLGFRGVEDLGGGLKASFFLDGAIGPDTGLGTSSYGNGDRATGAFAFLRRSTVSLSNQWGEVRLGRDYTPTFWTIGIPDPFGLQGVGNAGNIFISAEVRGLAGAGAAYGTLVRANNMVQYILPNGQFGPGLYGQFAVAAGENAPANKYYGGRLGYGAGPYDVSGSYGHTDVTTSGSITMEQWNLAGSWNFGVVKVSGYYGQIRIDGLAGGDATQDNWFIGAAAPIAQWNIKASYGQVKQSGNSLDGNKASQWAVGLDYNLSKRTAIYATVAGIDNTNTAYAVSATGPGPSRGVNSTGGELGVRHIF